MLTCHSDLEARRFTCPSFVGRDAELRQLEQAAEAAAIAQRLGLGA